VRALERELLLRQRRRGDHLAGTIRKFSLGFQRMISWLAAEEGKGFEG
jgi:hypothetical protein